MSFGGAPSGSSLGNLFGAGPLPPYPLESFYRVVPHGDTGGGGHRSAWRHREKG